MDKFVPESQFGTLFYESLEGERERERGTVNRSVTKTKNNRK